MAKHNFAKTPGRLNFIHATCCTASLDVIDFKCAPNFGEAQAIKSDKSEERLDRNQLVE
jgi:hypothetical protein